MIDQTQQLQLRFSLKRQDFTLDIDIGLPAQGVTVLFGPSGSGKTSLLRCVAGLERPRGQVAIGHELWQDSAQNLFRPAWQRDLGYVFQEASLFEHLNVQQNLEFGIQRAKKPGSAQALAAAVETLGIGHLRARQTASLSGGERQRVAIARALATQPRLLLLDEPMAALDLGLKREILPWLERLAKDLRIPALYVTHSIDEMCRLADHVVMLGHGAVQKHGGLSHVLESTEFAMALGDEAGIITEGCIEARDTRFHLAQVGFDQGRLVVRDDGLPIGQRIRIRILARDVSLSTAAHDQSTILNRIAGVIESIEADRHAAQALVRVRCGGTLLLARVTHRSLEALELRTGSTVWCQIKSVALIE